MLSTKWYIYITPSLLRVQGQFWKGLEDDYKERVFSRCNGGGCTHELLVVLKEHTGRHKPTPDKIPAMEKGGRHYTPPLAEVIILMDSARRGRIIFKVQPLVGQLCSSRQLQTQVDMRIWATSIDLMFWFFFFKKKKIKRPQTWVNGGVDVAKKKILSKWSKIKMCIYIYMWI